MQNMGVLLLSVVGIVLGVFLSVLSIGALFKVFQIGEDLRYMRSRNDIHVERPKSAKSEIAQYAIASVVFLLVLFVIVSFGMTASTR